MIQEIIVIEAAFASQILHISGCHTRTMMIHEIIFLRVFFIEGTFYSMNVAAQGPPLQGRHL